MSCFTIRKYFIVTNYIVPYLELLKEQQFFSENFQRKVVEGEFIQPGATGDFQVHKKLQLPSQLHSVSLAQSDKIVKVPENRHISCILYRCYEQKGKRLGLLYIGGGVCAPVNIAFFSFLFLHWRERWYQGTGFNRSHLTSGGCDIPFMLLVHLGYFNSGSSFWWCTRKLSSQQYCKVITFHVIYFFLSGFLALSGKYDAPVSPVLVSPYPGHALLSSGVYTSPFQKAILCHVFIAFCHAGLPFIISAEYYSSEYTNECTVFTLKKNICKSSSSLPLFSPSPPLILLPPQYMTYQVRKRQNHVVMW